MKVTLFYNKSVKNGYFLLFILGISLFWFKGSFLIEHGFGLLVFILMAIQVLKKNLYKIVAEGEHVDFIYTTFFFSSVKRFERKNIAINEEVVRTTMGNEKRVVIRNGETIIEKIHPVHLKDKEKFNHCLLFTSTPPKSPGNFLLFQVL